MSSALPKSTGRYDGGTMVALAVQLSLQAENIGAAIWRYGEVEKT